MTILLDVPIPSLTSCRPLGEVLHGLEDPQVAAAAGLRGVVDCREDLVSYDPARTSDM